VVALAGKNCLVAVEKGIKTQSGDVDRQFTAYVRPLIIHGRSK
jgi:hypothetical protein